MPTFWKIFQAAMFLAAITGAVIAFVTPCSEGIVSPCSINFTMEDILSIRSDTAFREKKGGKLPLDELVGLTFTRRQWAFLLTAISHAPALSPIQGQELETICAKIQNGPAPIGVLVRTLEEARDAAGKDFS
jgi:hypothetical protein